MILIMMIMLMVMSNSFKLFLIELLLEFSRPIIASKAPITANNSH